MGMEVLERQAKLAVQFDLHENRSGLTCNQSIDITGHHPAPPATY